MKLLFVRPKPELRPYVESLWIFESPTGMPAERQSLAAPNGCAKLIFLYDNSLTSVVNGRTQVSREGLYFVGARDCPTALHSGPNKIGFIGIEFYPQGAYPECQSRGLTRFSPRLRFAWDRSRRSEAGCP